MGIDEKALRQAAEALSHVHDYGRQSDLQAARVVVATYESAKQKEAVVERVTGRDEHDGVKTEVDVEVRADGVLHVTDMRQWRNEIEGEPATPTNAGAGMPSDLREVVKSALPDIAVAIEEWLFNGAADDQAAANIAALIRPSFEAKEQERDEFYRDGLKAEDKWIEWEARAISAEAKLREANMQALSDEGQMREIQAKLAQAVEAEREACALTAYRVCAETRHVTLGNQAARAIRARSASEHLTDRGEG
jgi:nitroreductase